MKSLAYVSEEVQLAKIDHTSEFYCKEKISLTDFNPITGAQRK
jgi:hypothetical protein